jgi:hypothetical protein
MNGQHGVTGLPGIPGANGAPGGPGAFPIPKEKSRLQSSPFLFLKTGWFVISSSIIQVLCPRGNVMSTFLVLID